MASVELKEIFKSFGTVEVINGLNLSVANGEFCALLGPSGCGKSTLLRMIAGLEDVSAGQVMIGDTDVTNELPAKRRVAMVFQNYALYPHLTVAANICFSLSLAGVSKAIQKERGDEIAKLLQLTDLMDRRPAELSGGQRQRVAIGRALIRNPEVFLFDEPLSNLDALLRVQMRLELAKLHASLKTTMIYVTHDQVEAMTLADKIVVLDSGKISQVGSPLELYNTPANRFVASFIGSPAMNFLNASIVKTGKAFTVALAGEASLVLPERADSGLKSGSDIEVGVRPEHVGVCDAGKGLLDGTITVVEQLGNISYLYVETSAGQIIVEANQTFSAASPGTKVGLTLSAEDCHIFDMQGKVWPAKG